jgi:mannan endo-1,6-alpha-mannosidase
MGLSLVALAALAASVGSALDLNVDSASSIKQASSNIVFDMMQTYTGNQTGDNPGNLPPPYYWWECGAMFMHMVDYYYCTPTQGNSVAMLSVS